MPPSAFRGNGFNGEAADEGRREAGRVDGDSQAGAAARRTREDDQSPRGARGLPLQDRPGPDSAAPEGQGDDIGEEHTAWERALRCLVGHERDVGSAALEDLVRNGLVVHKPTGYRPQVSLDAERLDDVQRIIKGEEI